MVLPFLMSHFREAKTCFSALEHHFHFKVKKRFDCFNRKYKLQIFKVIS
jgi:hypothetical protein